MTRMQMSVAKCNTYEIVQPPFLQDVLSGLRSDQKNLSPKYFYDEIGSKLFDDICELDEYYPYRTELAMLPGISRDLASMIDDDIDVYEFGAGSLIKIRPVLEHLDCIRRYIPIDIAGNHLLEATNRLCDDFENENVEVVPIEADFTRGIILPRDTDETMRMGFFPGSTIGNFPPEQAVGLLREIRASLGNNSLLLIGVDTKKEPWILHQAYNDNNGITAKFNKNLLQRINRELNGTFNLDNFEHYAFYNIYHGRVEMHLVSQANQEVSVNGETFSFRCGETIHTENSYKYSPDEFVRLAADAGWQSVRLWQDEENLFSHHLLYSCYERQDD